MAAPRAAGDRRHARGRLPGAALWRDRRFLTLAAAMALSLFAQIGLIAHLFSLLVAPLGPRGAGIAMCFATAAAIAGRSLVGWTMPQGTDRRLVACASHAVQIGALALLAAGANVPLLMLGVILFGLGIGNATSLPPLIAQAEFAGADVSRVVALIVAMAQAAYAFAPAAFGLIREFGAQGGGAAPLLFASAALVYALAVGTLLVGRGRSSDELVARISLQIEQRREIAVVDARMRGLRDLGLA